MCHLSSIFSNHWYDWNLVPSIGMADNNLSRHHCQRMVTILEWTTELTLNNRVCRWLWLLAHSPWTITFTFSYLLQLHCRGRHYHASHACTHPNGYPSIRHWVTPWVQTPCRLWLFTWLSLLPILGRVRASALLVVFGILFESEKMRQSNQSKEENEERERGRVWLWQLPVSGDTRQHQRTSSLGTHTHTHT